MYDEYNPNRLDELNIIDTDEIPMTLAELQSAICSIDHDENRVPDYFYKLVEEVGELSASIRKDERWNPEDEENNPFKGSIEEEVCDIIYYAVTLANIHHIDLTVCLREKEKLNAVKYNRPNVMP